MEMPEIGETIDKHNESDPGETNVRERQRREGVLENRDKMTHHRVYVFNLLQRKVLEVMECREIVASSKGMESKTS